MFELPNAFCYRLCLWATNFEFTKLYFMTTSSSFFPYPSENSPDELIVHIKISKHTRKRTSICIRCSRSQKNAIKPGLLHTRCKSPKIGRKQKCAPPHARMTSFDTHRPSSRARSQKPWDCGSYKKR